MRRKMERRLPGSWVRRRRGSTLLIVLALLSVLVLLAATLAFTSRIELISSRNFARHVQSREAELSSLQQAAALVAARMPRDAVSRMDLTLNDEYIERRKEADVLARHGLKNDETYAPLRMISGDLDNGLASMSLEDASARLNINTASEAQLSRFFGYIMQKYQVGAGADSRQLARAIVKWRLGADGAPGNRNDDDNRSGRYALDASLKLVETDPDLEAPRRKERMSASCLGADRSRLEALQTLQTGKDEGEEYVADIRYPAFGDDQRFQSVSDLAQIPGMTEELLRAASPFLTVFSVSIPPSGAVEMNTKSSSSGESADGLLDLNRATAMEIYQALDKLYGGEKDDMLLRQFAVNIVDARDADFIPMTLPKRDGTGLVIGLERSPFITEVYANSRTEGSGDEGEFVEIYNPWPDTIDLTGWTINIGGAAYPLAGALAPRGYMIVTDNYKEQQDNTLPGLGSFYDVFGQVAGPRKRIAEFQGLDIPHQGAGMLNVELRRQGMLIDQFSYTPALAQNTLNSFQRPGAGHVREVVNIYGANPFGLAPEDIEELWADRTLTGPQDVEFTSVLQLFDVFAAYAGATGERGARWAFPLLATPSSQGDDARALAQAGNTIDARIVDIFTVEPSKRPSAAALAKEMESGRLGLEQRQLNPYEGDVPFDLDAEGKLVTDEKQLEALIWQRYAPAARGLRHGLVNINTADEAVLVSVGLTQAQAAAVVERRLKLERAAREGRSGSATLYRQLSDILVDETLWGKGTDLCERLKGFEPLARTVTVNSRAFLLEGQALEASESGAPRKSGPVLRAVVALDKPRAELVTWGFTP